MDLTILDRALGYVAPRLAYRRHASRMALQAISGRGYDAAGRGPGRHGWSGGAATSADTEIAAAAPALRERMRELVRNNSLAAQAVQVLVNNMVGTGIRPRAATGDPGLDDRVNRLWARWCARSDVFGHTDFHGLTSLAVRQMIEGGEVLAVRRRLRRVGPGDVPLRIELREADHLDDARMSLQGDEGRIDQGIEFDGLGRRRAYWMFPDHPGGRVSGGWRRLQSVRIPAEDVAHLFERQRMQSRGVPWGVPAMRALDELGNWQIAELTRKRTEACLVGVVTSDEGNVSLAPSAGDGQLVDGSGRKVEQFTPGMIAYLRGGTAVDFLQPSAAGGVGEWNRVQMHVIAAGFRVPYALMTGDMSQANFSSTRAGLNEFRRMIEAVQWLTIVPMFCAPIWRWFLEAAVLAGELETDDIAVEWGPPKFESVNPLQDAQTDLLEVRAGFASLPQMVAKRGYDMAEVLAEHAEALRQADDLKLVLDSDGRRTSRGGQMQPQQPEDDDNTRDS